MEKGGEEPAIGSTEIETDASRKSAESVVVDVQEIEEEPLFFIDKTADSKTKEDMKVRYWSHVSGTFYVDFLLCFIAAVMSIEKFNQNLY